MLVNYILKCTCYQQLLVSSTTSTSKQLTSPIALFMGQAYLELLHSSLRSLKSFDIPPRSLGQMATPISLFSGKVGNVILRTIIWNIWLEKNARIFYDKYSVTSFVIAKSNYMFLSWIDAALETKARLEGSTVMAKHNLEFLGHHTVPGDKQSAE